MNVNKDETLSDAAIELNEADAAGVEAVKKTLGFGFWLSLVWLFVISIFALLAPVLPLKDPGENFVQYEERENPLTKKLEERPTIPPFLQARSIGLGQIGMHATYLVERYTVQEFH